jgi:PAS domain S-box-containing protein
MDTSAGTIRLRKKKAVSSRKVTAGRTGADKSGAQKASELEARVQRRFGVLPNFFRLAPENPEITANLWGFACFAYLDNPLPSLFKERLFVYLSRFCEVRYCIARHVGFLAGLGHASGDRESPRQDVGEIVRLLRRPLPGGRELEYHLSRCKEDPSLVALVDPDSNASRAKSAHLKYDQDAEEVLIGLASHVFLQTANASACLDALRALLGESRLQHLMVFLAFVRTAHYWTRVHPELTLEDDIKELLETHEVLTQCVLGEPESVSDEVSRRLLDELTSLRLQTDRSLAEQARLLDLSTDAILIRDAADKITYWNKGASELYGYTREEALGRVSHELLRTQFPAPLERITECIQRDGRWTGELIHKRKDESQIVVTSRWSLDRDDQGNPQAILETNNDITLQKQTAEALRESEERLRVLADGLEVTVRTRTRELEEGNREILQRSEQLRQLSNRLVRVQDEERRHIARELHDSVGQYLSGLIMALGEAQREIPGSSNLEEAAQIAQACLAETRTMSHLLHPPLLEEAGLASAVRWFVDGFAARSGIRAEVEIAKPLRRLGPEIELALFRVLQESLTNVHRHSGSKTVSIRIGADSQQVWLEVEDQGKGASNGFAHAGVGITGMRERVANLGGELGILSNPGGTRVRAVLPLARSHRSAKAAQQSRTAVS